MSDSDTAPPSLASSSCSRDLLAEVRRKPAKSPLLLYSGGLDSTVLLHDMRPAAAVFFDYGQRHLVEIFRAEDHCWALDIELHKIKLPQLQGSSLTYGNGDCVVPVRNLAMLSVAANIAIANGHDQITIGANATDRALFPDCRPGFLEYVRHAIMASGHEMRVEAPLLSLSKKEIAQKAKKLGIKRESVWWCYQGGNEPCGDCQACKAEQGIWE